MRALLALLALLLAACADPPPEALRLVTLEGDGTTSLAMRELPGSALESLGLDYGLAVVQAGAAGERAGLQVGDVVYGVEHTPVRNLEEFSRLLAGRRDGRIGLLVRRGEEDFYVALQMRAPGAPWAPLAPARDTLLRT